MDIKKTWEKLPRLSHQLGLRIAFHRDKQLSQPTPLGIIDRVCPTGPLEKAGWHTGIIHPAWTPRCGIFW